MQLNFCATVSVVFLSLISVIALAVTENLSEQKRVSKLGRNI